MQIPTDIGPLSISAFVQRFAGGGEIGVASLSIRAASLAAMGGQGRPVSFLTGNARCWPMDAARKNSHPTMILSFAERAQSILAFQPTKANSTGPVWDLAAKAAADPRAQGRAA
jgi:hypothetical protein